jgi:hypothetical protein
MSSVKLFFEKSIQFAAGIVCPHPAGPAVCGIPEGKIIAEVAPFFFKNPFCLGLAALVIGTCIMERAVPAAFEIGSAERAGLRATDPVRNRQLFMAAITPFHVGSL